MTFLTVPRARTDQAPHAAPELPFWAMPADSLAAALSTTTQGLTSGEARERLQRFGANRLRGARRLTRAAVLWRQLASPLLLLLVFAAGASLLSGEWLDAGIVIVIVVASAGIGYSREYSAQAAVAALQEEIRSVTVAVRDGVEQEIPVDDIVPGDLVVLAAGMLVPGDGLVVEATDLFVSESMLTGESFPVRKQPGVLGSDAALTARTNSVFLGTSVRSGNARCLIVRTGATTQFGAVAQTLQLHPPETEFDRGIRRFGYLLTSAMLVLVLVVFAAHVINGRPPVETLLFSVALAVGLSPELLPAILSVNLARGASLMAQQGVVVRRLNAIENLGSMDVLCTDKTGTLTEGVVQLEGAYDPQGASSIEVLREAARNAALESGVANPLDAAILAAHSPDRAGLRKRGEVPFDFARKRSSVVVEDAGVARLITKGTFTRVLDACTRLADGSPLDASMRSDLAAAYESWTGRGIRVLGLATRPVPVAASYSRDDEQDMVFLGYLTPISTR